MRWIFAVLLAGVLVLKISPAQGAPSDEIWALYRKGEAIEAARLGREALAARPDDLDLHQVTGRALVDSRQFSNALVHLERVVQLDTAHSWQSAWALAYAGYAHFGLGASSRAGESLEASLALHATRNVETFARRAQGLCGFGEAYRGWVELETDHFRFHFCPEVAASDTNRFATAHETAFGTINGFFGATLPKKVDFFVWARSEDARKAGLGPLGFARPEFTLVHAAVNQTVGHEMTHVLCAHGLHPSATTRLINEGVAVYFDQTRRDRRELARRAVREAGLKQVSIAEMWREPRAATEGVTYPLGGALVARLHARGGDAKLKALLADQTIESAQRIYGPELNVWLREFEDELLRE